MATKRPKSHYETLGVDSNASSADIKRSYRRKAAVAHPDKQSGDHDEMAELNHAFEVLINPKRRQLYDATGQDTEPRTEQHVNTLVMTAFGNALENDVPSILSHARRYIEQLRTKHAKDKAALQRALGKLQSRRAKVRLRRGEEAPNLLHLLIDQQLKRIQQALVITDDALANCVTAAEELGRYESDEDIKAPPKGIYVGPDGHLRFG